MTKVKSATTIVVSLVLASLVFVVSLSWNNTMQAVANEYIPAGKSRIKGQLIASIILTAILIGIGMILAIKFPKLVNSTL